MKGVICEETARLGSQVYHNRLRAVVLTGSLARDEGTFVKDEAGVRLLGDAEFLLVFDPRVALPKAGDVEVIRQKVEERILRRGVRADVTLSAVKPNYLRRLPPSIFGYELLACGKIVAGDAGVLGLIPRFTLADIPLEDAWRLLANRLVEQLETVDELLGRRPTLSPDAHYRTVKLYLDMATSLLVFLGGYAPTYEARARSLTQLAETAAPTPLPFPLSRFANDVSGWTAWKLNGYGVVADADRTFWERAVGYAEALWAWELAHLHEKNGDTALMTSLIRHQPLSARLRGWAHVVRQRGWHRSWRLWPRWLRQASQGSPRHLVYRAASTFVFELNAGADTPRMRSVVRRVLRDLPVATSAGGVEDDSPSALAATILANYRSFLRETRA
jgi:hypothetical protein